MDTRWSGIQRSTWAPDLSTSQVYQEVGAGKSRHDGALAGLGYFAVPDAPALVDEYAERKRQKVMAPIEAREFQAFSDGVRLLLDADKAGVRVAAASSSKNANLILGKLRLDELADEYGMAYDWIEPGQTLLDLLDLDISGRTFKQGKPHPEIFLTACRELGGAPRSCFVVEDAVSGVTAGKAGGMAPWALRASTTLSRNLASW
ncbi:MAG: HAD family hydrolase [Solirubrobacteraceae bacterium]